MQAPCKDCPDRVVGCHSTCEKYIEFRKYRDEYLAWKQKENKLLDDLYHTSRHSKTQKMRRGRPYADNRGGR